MRFTEYHTRLSAYAVILDDDDRILLSWYNGDGSPVTFADDHVPPRPYKAVRIVYGARVRGGRLGTTEVNGTTDRAAWLRLAGARPAAAGHRDLIDLAVAAARRENTV